MKTRFLMIFLVVSQISMAQSIKHGLTVHYGKSDFVAMKHPADVSFSKLDYHLNAAIGYKFRLNYESKPYFIDFDLGLGLHKYRLWTGNENAFSSGLSLLCYGSLGATYNYQIYKGLSAGAGIEPTLYYDNSYDIDFPLVAKISYDLKFIGVALMYKYGLTNALKVDSDITKGKIRGWQVQAFIPF
ncbi:MAG: hypothetical protein LBD53_05015 [Tannerella sp.]|jgi:hypothetical protein|nr:hypothetical protein [Tannerella sp.]